MYGTRAAGLLDNDRILPRGDVGREVCVCGALQGVGAQGARRLPGACATSTLATRFLRVRGRASSARGGVAQRLSATRFGLSPRHTQLNPGLGHFSTVIRAQFGRGRGWATGKSFAGERVVSARRRCGPRAPGEWRAPAPPLVAPRWKVKVSGGRGARWHISPTFAAVIHVASRSLPATPAPRTQRSRDRTRARRCIRALPLQRCAGARATWQGNPD